MTTPSDVLDAGLRHPPPGTVHVYVNPHTGDLTFHPMKLYLQHGQRATFVHAHGWPMTVRFRGGSPLPSGRSDLFSTGAPIVTPPLPAGRHEFGVAAQVPHGPHQGKLVLGHGAHVVVSRPGTSTGLARAK